ncbi:MAG: succinate dehydrogenase iron-sulfur subunit [Clostridia bacterium]|nr:succinate dehydrogenase iron-sulfur subunit [Clostridia bacterium]
MADATHATAVIVEIKRQERPDQPARWETFEVACRPGMNVIALLMEIRRRPVTRDGRETTPVAWEMACLEEVCGACTMLINGRVRQACSAIVDRLEKPIRLEPLTKFPLVRDLVVDRSVMFEQLKRIKAWIPIDGTYDLGPGPRMNEADRQVAYELSKCFTCGSCLEACPQYNPLTQFIGATNLSWVDFYGFHPTGAMNQHERLDAVMGPGGVQTCGNAQNCVQVCPKGIPLTNAIYRVKRAALRRAFQRWSES